MSDADRVIRDLIADRERLRRRLRSALGALSRIRDQEGRVCEAYSECDHVACRSSHAAWEIADALLRHGTTPEEAPKMESNG